MESDDEFDFIKVEQNIRLSDHYLYRVWRRPNQSCKPSNISERFKSLMLRKKPKAFKVKRKGIRAYPSPITSRERRLHFLEEINHRNPAADGAVSLNTKREFKKREITTIPEEVFHYKRHSKSISAFKEKKNYQEKVASLTVAVGRLREMCLAKPEVLQDAVPEEVMKLFSRIEIQ